MPVDVNNHHYEVYKGQRIKWRTTTHPDGQPQLVCYIEGWFGIWNSEKAAKDYIDFRLERL